MQAPRVVPRQPIVPCGLFVLACQPVVAGDLAGEGVRFAPAGLPCERRRGAAVQETLAGQAGLLVDQGSQLVVVEVVGRGPSDRGCRPPGSDLATSTLRGPSTSLLRPCRWPPLRCRSRTTARRRRRRRAPAPPPRRPYARRVLRRSCTPPGSVQASSPTSSSPFSTAARYSVEKERQPLRLVTEPRTQHPRARHGVPDQLLDGGGAQPLQGQGRRPPRPPGLGEQFSQAVSFVDLLGAPGEEHVDRLVVEPPYR